MTSIKHKSLANGRWKELSLVDQLANIGSEISRTISWQSNPYGKPQNAFYRALELLDLSIADPKNIGRLSELCRSREALVDWHLGSKLYGTSNEDWERYFYQFTYLSRGKS